MMGRVKVNPHQGRWQRVKLASLIGDDKWLDERRRRIARYAQAAERQESLPYGEKHD